MAVCSKPDPGRFTAVRYILNQHRAGRAQILFLDIAWHMAAGLLMQVNSLPSVSSKFHIPQDIINQCKAH